MSSKLYRHKETGKLYFIVHVNVKVKYKQISLSEDEVVLCWEDSFVLYKAEYDNPEGPYFVRYAKDFYENFEEVKIINNHDRDKRCKSV